jgi:hypothetical protein
MAEFAADLGRFLAGRPVAAARQSATTRVFRAFRRNRLALLALLFAVVASLFLGGGLSLYYEGEQRGVARNLIDQAIAALAEKPPDFEEAKRIIELARNVEDAENDEDFARVVKTLRLGELIQAYERAKWDEGLELRDEILRLLEGQPRPFAELLKRR